MVGPRDGRPLPFNQSDRTRVRSAFYPIPPMVVNIGGTVMTLLTTL